eukprot:comp24078_c1_seq1/m.43342 comp24078_c1_seq1/g.43342  ORF comp24078_c1_seq1/g.43342 comp24078_c1_seq1/m.43342 type:complete len:568 (-) comp24078_c1_seq1:241-1944(-)
MFSRSLARGRMVASLQLFITPVSQGLTLVRLLSTMADQPVERNYRTAVAALNSLQSNAAVIKALREKRLLNSDSISEMQELLRRIGYQVSDLDKLNIIHVAGTKGKGSTCAFAESILRNSGYKTGLYTSPHLIEVRERIRIDGKPIPQEMFSKYFWEVWDRLQSQKTEEHNMATYFRFLTLMAFHTFVQEKVQGVVLEVGIGGEYDPTNVVARPVVCGLTSIGYDHQRMLGSTIAEIAWHKAGIMKEGVPAITTSGQYDDAMRVFGERAREKRAPLLVAAPISKYTTQSGRPLSLGLAGTHQQHNGSLAAALCKVWLDARSTQQPIPYDETKVGTESPGGILNEGMELGLARARWPGRGHVICYPTHTTTFFLDGAHTIESLEACSQWMAGLRSGDARNVLLFNCSTDREPSTLLGPLLRLHRQMPFTDILFCPNVVSIDGSGPQDNVNHNVDLKEMLQWPKHTMAEWLRLTAPSTNETQPPADSDQSQATAADASVTGSQSNGAGNVHVFECVKDAIGWVLDTQAQAKAQAKAAAKDGSLPLCQVYVTGSLHLVGNVLTVLNQDPQ